MSYRIIKFAGLLIAALLLILLCIALWLNSGKLTQAKLNFFQKIPYPLALVNGHPVWMKDFILRTGLSKKLSFNGQTQAFAVYKQLINDEEVRQIASRHNVGVSQKEIEQAYKNSAVETNFEQTLKSYGLTPDDFKNQALKPQLILVNLEIWFNSQESLNTDAYRDANSLLKQIQSGQDMAALARTSTQDENGKLTGGDLGFVDPTALLEELKEPVAGLKPGEAKILPSRSGLHIIKNEGLSGNKIHLRQIFIKTQDFNQWLLNKKQNFKVWSLVKI